MAELYSIEKETLTGIADAIREKRGMSAIIPVSEMKEEILNISGGGEKTNEFKAPLYIDSIPGGQNMMMLSKENPFSTENINRNWVYDATIEIDRTNTSSTSSYVGFTHSVLSDIEYRMLLQFERATTTGGTNLKMLYRGNKFGTSSSSSIVTVTILTDSEIVDLLNEDNEMHFNITKTDYNLAFMFFKEGSTEESDIKIYNLPIKDTVGNDGQYLSFGGARVPTASNPYQMTTRTNMKNISFKYTS